MGARAPPHEEDKAWRVADDASRQNREGRARAPDASSPPARIFHDLSEMIDLETIQGLSTTQATERLAGDGYNELPAGRTRTFWRGLLDVTREPMTALLIGCGVIYFVLGDR